MARQAGGEVMRYCQAVSSTITGASGSMREQVAALALAADETVPLVGLDRVGALGGDAEALFQHLAAASASNLACTGQHSTLADFAQVRVGDQEHLVDAGADRRAESVRSR